MQQRQQRADEQDLARARREREGARGLSCHCYDCCNTLCEEITMSDYFVINKYKSEEYTHRESRPVGQRRVYAFLLSTLRVVLCIVLKTFINKLLCVCDCKAINTHTHTQAHT